MSRLLRLLLASVLAAPAAAYAQAPATAPSAKLGKIVIGFPPGASFDAVARLIADRFRSTLAQTWIVENRPGATGTIGAQAVAQAPADGNTLLLTPLAPMVTEPQVNKNVRYDPRKDFAPISMVATFEIALAVAVVVPAKTLPEYLAAVKTDASKGFFGSPGPNSLPHFFGLSVGRAAGVELTHVPFNGPAPAMQAVLGGQTAAIVHAFPDLYVHHKAGKMRLLATSGAARSKLAPDVPTFKELAFEIEGTSWYAFFAPAGTPAETVARLNRAVAEAVRSPQVTDYLVSSAHQPTVSTPAELAAILARDYARWGTIIRSSGIKLE